jgi:hypothetical protein
MNAVKWADNQALVRLDAAAEISSPDRLWPPVLCAPALVRRQLSKGLPFVAALGFIGLLSVAFLLPKRVVRAVVGGEAGACRGALGVPGASSTRSTGVSGFSASRPASTWSSISVGASSSEFSSFDSSAIAVGKRSRGLMDDRVKCRLGVSTALSRPPSPSSKLSSSSENFRNCFLPRLPRYVSRSVKE